MENNENQLPLLDKKMLARIIQEIGLAHALASVAFDSVRNTLPPEQQEVMKQQLIKQIPISLSQVLGNVSATAPDEDLLKSIKENFNRALNKKFQN